MLSRNLRLDQKARELLQFEVFRATSRVVPDCPNEQPDPPEPDIVLNCPDGRIGIELTEIHPSGIDKPPREGEQTILLKLAKKLYSQTGLPPVHVHAEWTALPKLSKSRRNRVAEVLRDLVVENRPSNDEVLSRDVDAGEGLVHPELPIRALAVSWASSQEASDWRDWNFHNVEPPDPGELQERMRNEEGKLGISRWAYASRWLVLVAGAGGPSTWTVPGASLERATFRSRYDRAFLCMVDRGKSIELVVVRD